MPIMEELIMPQLTAFVSELQKFCRWKIWFAILLMVAASAAEGLGLLLLRPLLDFFNHNKLPPFFAAIHFQPSLAQILVFYVVIITFIALLNFVKATFNGNLQLQFARDLQQKLYSKFITSHWLDITKIKHSDFNQLLTSEVTKISYGVNVLAQLVTIIVLTVAYLTVSFFVSWQLTSIAFLVGLLLYFGCHLQSPTALRLGEKNFHNMQNYYRVINDHLLGVKLAKTYRQEKKLMEDFTAATKAIMQQNAQFIALQARNTLIYSIAGVLAFSIVFYFAFAVLHTPFVTLFILLIIFARLMPKLAVCQQYYQNLLAILPSFKAVQDLLQTVSADKISATREEVGDQNVTLQDKISLQDVSFNHARGQVFSNVSFDIPAKQVTAIIGPSGTGKSTLVDIITGLIEPLSGKVLLDGVNLRSLSKKEWSDVIACIHQNDNLFNGTIRQNLTWMFPHASEDELTHVLQQAKIYDFVRNLPQGVDTPIGENGICLAGGEKQRIILARALLRKPSILILDEATNELDVPTEAAIFDTIRRWHKDLTIVLVSHRLTAVNFADNVFKLAHNFS
jgi:ATP-binding cassette, subfamily C, bacterial